MTVNEFKAWLEGYSENISDCPTPEQWKKIKEKLLNMRSEVVNNSLVSPPFSPVTLPLY